MIRMEQQHNRQQERRLRQLRDVSAKRPTDGQALLWSDSEGKWVPEDIELDIDPDQFAPSLHASQHFTGGDDEITPADIGASPADHSHIIESVSDSASGVEITTTSGTTDVASVSLSPGTWFIIYSSHVRHSGNDTPITTRLRDGGTTIKTNSINTQGNADSHITKFVIRTISSTSSIGVSLQTLTGTGSGGADIAAFRLA